MEFGLVGYRFRMIRGYPGAFWSFICVHGIDEMAAIDTTQIVFIAWTHVPLLTTLMIGRVSNLRL